MIDILKKIVRISARRLGYGVLNLRQDHWPGVLLPGHLKSMLTSLSINCVVDVGANVGQYASMLRAAGYHDRIVSIEPVPETYERLEQAASEDASWTTLNVALGEQDETKLMNVFAASDLSSFLSPSVNIEVNLDNSHVTRIQPVITKRLDSIFGEIVAGISAPRVFLKLDTQGYDLRVLKGAVESLSYVHGIQSEVSVIPLYDGMPDYLEALTYYRQLGFEPTTFVPVVHARHTGHVLEFDVVLRRRSSHKRAQSRQVDADAIPP